MKKCLLLSIAMVSSGLSLAQDVGRVLSSTPILQKVAVPRNICRTEQVAVTVPTSGAGAVMGAIAGGAMGNAVGGGSGRAAATMLGLFGGAIIGDRIEGSSQPQVQTVQRCGVQTYFSNRPVAYNVVYEFAGKQYAVQIPYEPGPTLPLHITPVDAGATIAAPVSAQAPTYAPPSNLAVSQIHSSQYYGHPYYPPMAIELNFGYGDGHRGRRHWR